MIGIEFSALARPCSDRRLPTQEQRTAEVQAMAAGREQKRIQIDWPFSIASARSKFRRHYRQVHAGNAPCDKT